MAKRSRHPARRQVESTQKSKTPPSPPFAVVKRAFASAWWPLVVAAIAFLVYVPSLRSDLISDARLEINEGFVTSLSNLPQILSLHVLGLHLMLSDRPGEMLYLMLNAALWGKTPFGYHLSSIVLHAVNVGLLLALLRRLLEGENGDLARIDDLKIQFALTTAVLLFALHPVAAESVSEVSFSSSLLVTLFTLLALLAATTFRPAEKGKALALASVGILCTGAAVFTKESGIAIALLLIVYWAIFRREDPLRPWLIFLGAALAVTAVALGAILRFAVSQQMHVTYLGGSFGQVFLIQPQLWVFMMGQLLWPTHLSADYTLADMNLPSIPMAFTLLAIVIGLQIWLSRHSRIGALGVATYWLGLVTVSNFLPLYCILADRFYYLPLVGVAMQLAGVFLLLVRYSWGCALATGLIWVALPLLAFLTVTREAVFAQEESLWADTLQKSPHSSLTYRNEGMFLFQQGRTDAAMADFEQAVTVNPNDSTAYNWIGFLDAQQGQLDAAIAAYEQALALDPRNGDAHFNLGMALCRKGNLDEGVEHFREALALDPQNASAHTQLGIALAQMELSEQAIAQFQDALQINPHSAEAHFGLGNVLARGGKSDQAMAEFQKTLQLDPNDFEARMNLGVLFLHQGQFDQAIVQFRQAVQLQPNSADSHDDLGVALIQKGDVPAAIAQFQEALRLDPDCHSAQINLAKAQQTGPVHL